MTPNQEERLEATENAIRELVKIHALVLENQKQVIVLIRMMEDRVEEGRKQTEEYRRDTQQFHRLLLLVARRNGWLDEEPDANRE